MSNSKANEIELDYNHVQYIEYGNKKTYTFKILSPESSSFQNLVIIQFSDGTIQKRIITYSLSEQEKQDLLNGNMINFSGRIASITPVKDFIPNSFGKYYESGGKCYTENVEVSPCGSGQHNSSNMDKWHECTHPKKAQVVLSVEEIDCPSGGGGSGTGSGNVGGNPLDPNNGGIEFPTTPILFNMHFIRFINTLPQNLQNVINSEDNLDYYTGLNNYFYYNNKSNEAKIFINWAIQFKADNPSTTWEQFEPMLTFAHNFLQENPDTINPEKLFYRLKALDDALTQNPNLLLNIPCSQLPEWQTLANHPIPVSVKNKIYQINGMTGWFKDAVIQNLDYSSSFTINMDVYPVKIANMPEKSPGIKYTPAEFFDYFRKNINDFTDVNHGKFYPVVEPQYGIDDTELWNSTNPLGSLITIKIPADNGTVVCTGFGAQAWIFTTVKSPWDGEHPVSGNRLFGYFIDSSGNMVIYTRGVDRFTTKVSNNALQYTIESFGYSEAKTMWETMQQKVSTFVNSKNGSSTILPGIDYTPNYIFVKDYIKGTKQLNQLGCH